MQRARRERIELGLPSHLVALVIVSLPALLGLGWFAIVGMADWFDHRNDHRFPLVHGTIQSVEMVTREIFISRPELSIRIDDTGELVHARLWNHSEKDFPDGRVSFHYTGDPSWEVRLVGETTPWLLVGILLALGMLFLVAVFVGNWFYHRKLTQLDEQEAAERA